MSSVVLVRGYLPTLAVILDTFAVAEYSRRLFVMLRNTAKG
jgi:hypothetical protein